MEFIAERKLQGVDKNGQQLDIVVGIGTPYKDKNIGSWACPLKIEGLHKSLTDQHGIDSWQAIRLSQKLIISLLLDFIGKGGKLYIFDEKDEVTKDEIEEFF